MKDTICTCGHWYEEHNNICVRELVAGGENILGTGSSDCMAPNCSCKAFAYSAKDNTPQAIADRGGEHSLDCECALCKTFENRLRRAKTLTAAVRESLMPGMPHQVALDLLEALAGICLEDPKLLAKVEAKINEAEKVIEADRKGG